MSCLSIAFDLPSAPEAINLLRRCVAPLEPATERIVEQDDLLTRLVISVRQDPAIYRALVECLVRVDQWALSKWHFPPLYQSGIVYEAEPAGVEVWQSSPALDLRGRGDCEDLAAHRTSEHRFDGREATTNMDLSGRTSFGGRLYHFNVRLKDGSIEDPSRVLGME